MRGRTMGSEDTNEISPSLSGWSRTTPAQFSAMSSE
jgi:hypothetical protein